MMKLSGSGSFSDRVNQEAWFQICIPVLHFCHHSLPFCTQLACPDKHSHVFPQRQIAVIHSCPQRVPVQVRSGVWHVAQGGGGEVGTSNWADPNSLIRVLGFSQVLPGASAVVIQQQGAWPASGIRLCAHGCPSAAAFPATAVQEEKI